MEKETNKVNKRKKKNSDWRTLIISAVKNKMNSHGITQVQLAEQTGFSQPYVSQLLKGNRKPNIETMMVLAQWADVTDALQSIITTQRMTAC